MRRIAILLLALGCGEDKAGGASADVLSADAAIVDASPDVAEPDAAAPDAGCADCDYQPVVSANDVRRLTGLSFPRGAAGRRLPLLVRYAADAPQPLPVIIWSHGGSWNDNGERQGEGWGEALASAGYLVIHWGMATPDAEQLRTLCELVELPDLDDCVDLSLGQVGDDDDPADNPFSGTAVTRPADVAAMLADLEGLAGKIEMDTGVELDLSRVGLAGHSAGSQSVQGIAGAVRIVADSIPAWGRTHPLPTAFVGISPQPAGQSGFFTGADGTSWDAVRGPLLIVTGEGDEKPDRGGTGATRRTVFEHLPPGDKALFYSTMEGPLRHGSYNLGDLDVPELGEFNAVLRAVVVAWFDAHLRGNAAAQAWLDAGHPVDAAGGRAEWLTK